MYPPLPQGRVIGDVARKECTTLLHSFPPNGSDVYFLRLECHETQITFSETVNILAQPGNEEHLPELGVSVTLDTENLFYISKVPLLRTFTIRIFF